MSGIYVGVDAGGSRTVAAIARGSEPPGILEGAGANPNVVGMARAAEAIADLIDRACGGERIAGIAIGVAGAGPQGTRCALEALFARRFPGVALRVTDDAHIALRGAIPSGDGMVLIAGTGSIAHAEIGDRRVRVGGFGYLLGDEGSGYAIGAAAMRSLGHAFEGRVPYDAMLKAIAEHLGVTSSSELIERVYASQAPVATIAGCAPLVLHAAGQGERNATKIVQGAAQALFDLVRDIVQRCSSEGNPAQHLPLGFSGGLLKRNSLLTYLLETRIANEFPEMTVVKNGEAWQGALAEARSLR